jgi:hypothetical protein
MTLRPQISLGLRFSVSRAALIALDPSGVNPKLLFGQARFSLDAMLGPWALRRQFSLVLPSP